MAYFNNFTNDMRERIDALSNLAKTSTTINPALYESYGVKRGLRDVNGKGVLAGLTEISEILSSGVSDGTEKPCDGKLYYRGYDIEDIVAGFIKEDRLGFEEVAYLLLFGALPTDGELSSFNEILGGVSQLPARFVRDVIMKKPSNNMMNTLAKSVLTLYAYDENPEDISISNVLRQGLQLTGQFPLLSVYGYQVYSHYYHGKSLIVHNPVPGYSTAENILHMLRADNKFSKTEARILDLCLVLHAEHGGGNNSSFTTHVVSSSGTDTYSVIAAALGSLKGPRHGGANIKVVEMMDDIKANLPSYSDEDIKDYLGKLLDKEAFDKSGLIYGMGHAVYSISDPRATILRQFVEKLAVEKGMDKEFELYEKIERLAPEVISDKRKIYKGVSANVDFYSGLLYRLLDLPLELYTPIFAIARIVGWTAHRIEELSNGGKIIRPGYTSIAERKEYKPLSGR